MMTFISIEVNLGGYNVSSPKRGGGGGGNFGY